MRLRARSTDLAVPACETSLMNEFVLALVSDDVHDSVAQCAAAAGYGLLDADVASCGRAWRRCHTVVVDPVNVVALGALSIPRRDRVVLVARAAEPAQVWRAGVALGIAAAFELPVDEAALVRHLTESRMASSRSGTAVAIIGGHGGAGATVLAAATALVASTEQQVLLVDADECGAGIDLILGVEDAQGLRWQDFSAATGTISASALHEALPRAGERMSVLTGRRDELRPIPAATVGAVIDAGRGAGGFVVVDLPRADVEVTRAALTAVDAVVILTSAGVAGVAATRAVHGRLLASVPVVELVVRGPTLGGLRPRDVADAVGIALLTAYRPDPRLAARLETTPLSRLLRKPLRAAATDVVDRVVATRGVAA